MSVSIRSETVHFQGDWTTPGAYDGDLVVTNGSITIFLGDLTVNGDVKVTSGKIQMCGGHLKVNGDLIVTNTKPLGQSDASVFVAGDVEVSGAIITKSSAGKAYIDARRNYLEVGGSLKAGRISTSGELDAYVATDHIMTVTGAIVTRSEHGHAFVYSRGEYPLYGDIYAGEIFTYAKGVSEDVSFENPCQLSINRKLRNGPPVPSPSGACILSTNGHLFVTGPIVTYAKTLYVGEYESCFDTIADAFVYAHGDLEAASITTYADHNAYITAEKITVYGDIRTEAQGTVFMYSPENYQVAGGYAHVEARMTSLQGLAGSYEDIIAQNIYTKGYSSAYVQALRNIDVRGDIVTWEHREEEYLNGNNYDSAYVAAGFYRYVDYYYDCYCSYNDISNDGIGWIKAQNIMTKSPGDAYVRAESGIDVTGEIITQSDFGSACVTNFVNDIKAGNIATYGWEDARIHNEGDGINVTHVIATKGAYVGEILRNGTKYAYVNAGKSIGAEKIFTDGYDKADVVASDKILVKGPIVTKSCNWIASVLSANDLRAGAITTDGYHDSSVVSANGSVNVIEDIRTKSSVGISIVHALNGNITARSIRTESPNQFLVSGAPDDSIKAAPGSAKFTLVPNPTNEELTIKDAEFDLDSDHEWPTMLSIEGTCTLNGKGHHLNLTDGGGIVVKSGSNLYLQNITIRNVHDTVISCEDSTATLSVHNVTLLQSDDYTFADGALYVAGDLHIKGPGTRFIYTSDGKSFVEKNATLLFDHGVTFVFGEMVEMSRVVESDPSLRLHFVDSSSRMHFNDSVLDAIWDIRLKTGTLVFDNTVTFSAAEGVTLYFGNNNAPENIAFEFHEASKLLLAGDYSYQNV